MGRGRLLEQVLEAVHGFPRPGWCARDGEATRVPSRRNIWRERRDEPSSQWQRWTTERGGEGRRGRAGGRAGQERSGGSVRVAWTRSIKPMPCGPSWSWSWATPRSALRVRVRGWGRGQRCMDRAHAHTGPVTWAAVVLLWLNRVGPPPCL